KEDIGGVHSPRPGREGAEEGGEVQSGGARHGVGGGESESALAGRAWHSPANLNDGAATSSMSLLDKP
ncbi:RND transporter, partial [Klebsiella pneumoniae]